MLDELADEAFDLAVIGAGSAGFAAAIRGAELGARVALIGHGVGEDLALGRGALEALDLAGIEVQRAFLGARRSSQAFAVAAADLVRAARALHGFVLSHKRWSGKENRP